jgi:hypothetical protein
MAGGPSWLSAALAAIMIIIACYCAGRLAVARSWRRPTDVDADALHTVMGVAMAGMLLPRLSPLPGAAWEAVFGVTAGWFAWRAIQRGSGLRGTARPGAGPGGTAPRRWRSAHPVPHLVESAAMIYMFAALPSPVQGAMGGMGRPDGSVLALAVVLALFMVGYVLWTADQLTALRSAAARTPRGQLASSPALAPGLAACAKIAMGATMGYMLLVML